MSKNRFVLCPVTVAALVALSFQAAHAQTATSTPAAATLPTVTVNASADASAEGLTAPYAGGQVARGGRIGILGTQDMMDTPFNTLNFTQELIQNQQAKSVGDVLLNDPAVRTARGFGNFQQTYFVRGFPIASDDVAYNGLYGLVPRQYLGTEFIERIDVFRGASAFLNGVGSGVTAGGGLGGLINIVPKRAPNESLNQVTVGVESGGQGYLAADIARRFGPDQATGIRLNAAARDGNTAVNREKQKLGLLSIGLDWRSSNVRLSADIGYQDSKIKASQPNVTLAAGIPVPAVPNAKNSFAQPWTYSNEDDTFATVRAEVDFNSAVTGWAAVGVRTGNESGIFANPTVNAANGSMSADRFDNVRKDDVSTAEVGLRAKLRTGSIGHTFAASIATYKFKTRSDYASSSFFANNTFNDNLFNSTPVALPVNSTFGFSTEEIKNDSFALSDTLSMFDDRLLTTIGVRRQTVKDDTGGTFGGTKYDQSRTTPLLGVVFKASKEVSVYANYIDGLVKGDAAPTGSANFGTTLAPYRAKQKEIGVKYDAGKFGGTLAFFSTKKPSAFLNATTNVYGEYGEQRNQGVELSAFGELTRGVRLLGGLTLLDAKLLQTGTAASNNKQVIGVPRQQANLGAEWDLAAVKGLSLNARVLHTGPMFVDGANTQELPAWTRLDVGARYVMELGGKLVTLRGRIDNLTNRNYWASAGGYPGRGYLVIGAPRTVSVTASVDF